jgi:hypothetical protein
LRIVGGFFSLVVINIFGFFFVEVVVAATEVVAIAKRSADIIDISFWCS